MTTTRNKRKNEGLPNHETLHYFTHARCFRHRHSRARRHVLRRLPGIVSLTQGATGQAVGNSVAGRFDLDSLTGSFLNFSIAGQSIAPDFASTASIGPARTDAIYTAQISPVSTGMPQNSTFSLDLSSLTTWPSTLTPYTLLIDNAAYDESRYDRQSTIRFSEHLQLLHSRR